MRRSPTCLSPQRPDHALAAGWVVRGIREACELQLAPEGARGNPSHPKLESPPLSWGGWDKRCHSDELALIDCRDQSAETGEIDRKIPTSHGKM